MNNMLSIIATAHNEIPANRVFIDSMIMQTNKEFKATVFHNGISYSMVNYMMERCEGCDNIYYRHSNTDSANWGTANRQQAIDECDTEYIIQTSVQDYWLPQAVEYILKALENKPSIVVWNSINHLVGPCQVLDSKLEWSKIDWGNFAIRTDIARKMRIQQDQYCADWLFIKECLDRKLIDTKKIIKINGILTIHN